MGNFPYIISGIILASHGSIAVISKIDQPPDCSQEWDYYYQRYVEECDYQEEAKPTSFVRVGDSWHGLTVESISYRTVIFTINSCRLVVNIGEPFSDLEYGEQP